jgi:hypothetical protein
LRGGVPVAVNCARVAADSAQLGLKQTGDVGQGGLGLGEAICRSMLMSESGPTRKSSERAYIVRCSSNNGLNSDIAGGPFSAKGGSRQLSFDHLVGERQQGRGTTMPSAFAVF